MDQPKVLRIGQVATESGISIDAIRYYERLGLLPPAPRTPGGFRTYSGQEVDRLRAIQEAKRLGLSLREIRAIVEPAGRGSPAHCREVRAILDARLREVEARVEELTRIQRVLAEARAACDGALSAPGERCCPVAGSLGVDPDE